LDRERAKELLSEYLDGDLEPADREALEALLAEDPVLRADLEALRRTLEALGALPDERPSDDFLSQVKQKLKRQRKSPLDVSFGMDRKIPFEAVSMILIGILLALYLILVALPKDQTSLSPEVPRLAPKDAGAGDGGRQLPRSPPMDLQD
jgi:anti-sigma factor RsiW